MKLRVNSKGQIHLPDELQKKYGIVAGTRIVFVHNGDLITLKPITEEHLKNFEINFYEYSNMGHNSKL